MKKALVTGSTGFVGSHLCKALLTQGWQVKAFHRPASDLELLQGLPLEHCLGDITQPATLEAAMKDVSVVFHAAAQLGSPKDPAAWYQVTVNGTRNVMQAALAAGVERVVHTSSVAALGVPTFHPARGQAPELMDENHTWNYPGDRWSYGCAKYLAELQVQKSVACGLDAVIVNPSNVLGSGDLHRRNNSIVALVASRRIPVSVQGGLNAVHVEDVVLGHLAALERGKRGERYILGAENISHVDLMRRIASVAGVPAPRLVLPGGLLRALAGILSRLPYRNLPVDPQQFFMAGYYFYYDTSKARQQLALPKSQSIQIAIREAYDWFCHCS